MSTEPVQADGREKMSCAGRQKRDTDRHEKDTRSYRQKGEGFRQRKEGEREKCREKTKVTNRRI